MEQLLFVLANPMSKALILLGGSVVSLYALLTRFATKVRGSFKPYQKATLLYSLVFLLFFALIGFIAHSALFSRPGTTFIFYQVVFLLAGVLHGRLMYQYLKWSGDDRSFWLELIFTIILALLSAITFVAVYNFLSKSELTLFMAGTIFCFIIPFFFQYSFSKAVAIPPKVRKQWLYPVHEEVAEPDESKLKNLLIISFEFQKQTGDSHYTNFRAKAPTDMEFGQLFYYFINDYNERHPNSKIQYVNGAGEPHGWIFYKKPKWYSFTTEYIDTEKTIYNNHIRENEVIICSRSLN